MTTTVDVRVSFDCDGTKTKPVASATIERHTNEGNGHPVGVRIFFEITYHEDDDVRRFSGNKDRWNTTSPSKVDSGPRAAVQ
ncbi:hypothetical protein AnigIFM60653_009027 [Aspergillus niger]|nr:hypothetical protein AnigIFM60653_009027 [Aspergillus niger]